MKEIKTNKKLIKLQILFIFDKKKKKEKIKKMEVLNWIKIFVQNSLKFLKIKLIQTLSIKK